MEPKGAKSEPKDAKREPKRPEWSQSPSKIHQNGSQNRHERQGRFWMAKIIKTDPKWSEKASKIYAKSLQKSMQKSMPKRCRKMKPKWIKMHAKWYKKWDKFCLFAKWWFCENLAFTIVKARFSRFRGSKNRWEIDPKTMQKHDSKKLCKNNQKWCPNGVQIDPKSTKSVVKSRCENRCENQCKTAPSKGGSAGKASAPLVVLSRHTLYLFLSIIFPNVQ